MIASEKKICPELNIGDKVAVWFEDRVDQKAYGVVIENTEKMCVIERNDVPIHVMYPNGRPVGMTQKVYVFGTPAEAGYDNRSHNVRIEKVG